MLFVVADRFTGAAVTFVLLLLLCVSVGWGLFNCYYALLMYCSVVLFCSLTCCVVGYYLLLLVCFSLGCGLCSLSGFLVSLLGVCLVSTF